MNMNGINMDWWLRIAGKHRNYLPALGLHKIMAIKLNEKILLCAWLSKNKRCYARLHFLHIFPGCYLSICNIMQGASTLAW